jgi:hypothetical protein
MAPCQSWNGKELVLAVGGIFFPRREAMGLDSRELTPAMVQRIVHAAAETRSSKRAALVLQQIGGNEVSPSTIQRVTHQVGMELAELRDGGESPELVQAPLSPPELAVVEADGGRIRTRQPGQGRGVHGEAWRETKNANLLRMTHRTFTEDPEPELPPAFADPKRVAKLAEKEAPPELSGVDCVPQPVEKAWRPKRLVRTCLSSMAEADVFGQQMKREADCRRFPEALARAFVGDGLPWNWSIWKHYFSDFIPILDFIHALSYLYAAALAMHSEFSLAWSCYLRMARACWQGRVMETIEELRVWLAPYGLDDKAKLDDKDPRKPIVDAARYLRNNRSRMDYPHYRCLGLPVTSALMESLVKEVNYRVKGTEMFWNDPDGAEAILQVRAAALCDDDRLTRYLATRPGCPYVRRSTLKCAV